MASNQSHGASQSWYLLRPDRAEGLAKYGQQHPRLFAFRLLPRASASSARVSMSEEVTSSRAQLPHTNKHDCLVGNHADKNAQQYEG